MQMQGRHHPRRPSRLPSQLLLQSLGSRQMWHRQRALPRVKCWQQSLQAMRIEQEVHMLLRAMRCVLPSSCARPMLDPQHMYCYALPITASQMCCIHCMQPRQVEGLSVYQDAHDKAEAVVLA